MLKLVELNYSKEKIIVPKEAVVRGYYYNANDSLLISDITEETIGQYDIYNEDHEERTGFSIHITSYLDEIKVDYEVFEDFHYEHEIMSTLERYTSVLDLFTLELNKKEDLLFNIFNYIDPENYELDYYGELLSDDIYDIELFKEVIDPLSHKPCKVYKASNGNYYGLMNDKLFNEAIEFTKEDLIKLNV